MATATHRTTKEHSQSVHTPDFPTATYIINSPEAATLHGSGVPTKYWKITGDLVEEMTQPEKDAVDAAEVAAQEAATLAELDAEPSDPISVGGAPVRLRALVELFNKRDNYLVNRIAELQTALTDLQSSSGGAAGRLNGLPASYLATNTRTKQDAIDDYKADVAAGNQNS